MKKFTLSTIAVLAMSSMVMAGGDIEPVVAPIEEVAPAPDDSGVYMGLGFTHVNTNIEADYHQREEGQTDVPEVRTMSIDGDVTTSMTTFLAGYQFNKYFAVEGRYIPQYIDADIGLSMDGDSESLDASLSMSNLALYAKGMYPVGDFTLYGLLGYGQSSADVEIMGESPDELDRSDSSFQWGIGAAYALNESTSLFIDYTQLYNGSDFDGVMSDINDMIEYESDGTAWIDNTDISAYAITFGMTYKF